MGNYVRNSVTKGEEVVCEARQHWISLLPRGIVSAILLLGGLASPGSFFLMLIVAAIIMAKPFINVYMTELGFTNKRLIGKTGLINTKSLDSPLNKINNVSVNNGFWGKILGYGNVNISTSSGAYVYHSVAQPEDFKSRLMNQIDQFDEDRIKKQATEMANAIKEAQ